jgi:hypothetical protein
VRPRAADALDLSADRDNFRDNPEEIWSRATRTLAYPQRETRRGEVAEWLKAMVC